MTLQHAVAGLGNGKHFVTLERLLLTTQQFTHLFDLPFFHLVFLVFLQGLQEAHVRQHCLCTSPASVLVLLAQRPEDAEAEAHNHDRGRWGCHGLDLGDVFLIKILESLRSHLKRRNRLLQCFVGFALFIFNDYRIFGNLVSASVRLFLTLCHYDSLFCDCVDELAYLLCILIDNGLLHLKLSGHLCNPLRRLH